MRIDVDSGLGRAVRAARGRALAWSVRALARVRSVLDGEPRTRSACPYAGVRGMHPFAPATLANPYPFYEALRTEAPAHHVEGADYVLVSRYEDVRAVALDPETYSSNLVAILLATGRGGVQSLAMRDVGVGPSDVLALADPPDHAAQRKLTSAVLSMRAQRRLDEDIRTMTDELLTRALARPEFDFMHEVAEVLPMRLVLRLVGFPEDDHREVKRRCDHAVALLAGVNTPKSIAVHVEEELALYRWVIDEFRRAVARSPRSDLVDALVDAMEGRGEVRITENEATSLVLQVLIAGSDSSASAMGSAMHRLAADPELAAGLRAAPERIPAFVEEILRLESPFQGHFRITTRDTELGGRKLGKGTRLMLLWASANRDPAQFEDPERLDLERTNPRKHMAFGHGPHLCLGAHLARREITIMVEEMLARTTHLALGRGPIQHRPSVFTRTLEHLFLAPTSRFQDP